MFGILKTGLKLGVGCFIAGILFVLLIIGAVYYYFMRKPAPHPRNTNRRAVVLPNRAATPVPVLRATRVSARPLFQDGDGFFSRVHERQPCEVGLGDHQVLAQAGEGARPALA